MFINYNELNKKYAEMSPQEISKKVTEELQSYYEKKQEEDKKEKKVERAKENLNKAVNEYLAATDASDIQKKYIKEMISYLTSKKFHIELVHSAEALDEYFNRLSNLWSHF